MSSLPSTVYVGINQTYNFDVIGIDAYGNIANSVPAFSTTGGIGSTTTDGTGAHFHAGLAAASGTLKATLGGLTDSINVSIYVPPLLWPLHRQKAQLVSISMQRLSESLSQR